MAKNLTMRKSLKLYLKWSMYDNGEIAEVRDELSEIVNAIDEFERQYNMKE